VAANTNRIEIYPATGAALSTAGTGDINIGAVQTTNNPYPTSYGTVARNADTLSFPFSWAPQEMTVYVKFIELGSIIVTATRILQISTNSQARLQIQNNAGFYRATHNNGSASVTSTLLAAPTYGQLVELRVTLGSDGKVQIGQALDGGSETTAAQSAANALATAWGGSSLLYLNQDHAAANMGAAGIQCIRFAAGTKTLAEMRAI
jgi:hypothetical protein